MNLHIRSHKHTTHVESLISASMIYKHYPYTNGCFKNYNRDCNVFYALEDKVKL